MTMLSTLSARQLSDGSFGWYPGMRGNVWMTTEVAMLLSRLGDIKDALSVPEREMLDKAMSYLEKDIRQMLKKNTGYKQSIQYQRIQHDVEHYLTSVVFPESTGKQD